MNSPRTEEDAATQSASARSIFAEGWAGVFASRILPASFFLLVELVKIRDLISFLSKAEPGEESPLGVAFYTSLGYKSSVIFFLGLVVLLFVIRFRPVRKAQGVKPKVVALLGAFQLSLIAFLPEVNPSIPQTTAATLLLLLGSWITIAALVVLGRSFSIMPEARKLVTNGPYSLVRHPMYLGEVLAGAGMVLQSVSALSLLTFVVFIYVQIARMKYEERVLQQEFPDYEGYKRRTARLIPKVY